MPNLYDPYDTAGEQISSTYEGRHITLRENLLNHPLIGLVQAKDPVIAVGGNSPLCGVAFNTATAATDQVAIDTEGIWALTVYGIEEDGTMAGVASNVAVGDRIYINRTTCLLTKRDDPDDWVPFGWALMSMTGSLTTPDVIAVKVHPEFSPDYLLHIGYFGGDLDVPTGQRSWLRAYIKPGYAVTAEFVGMYNRTMNDNVATTGSVWAGQHKAVNTVDATFAQLSGFMANADHRAGEVTWMNGLTVMCEGAGTAQYRTGIRFLSPTGVGTLTESLFQLETVNTFGTKVTTAANPVRCLAVDVAGTVEYLQLYTTCAP